MQYFFNPRSQYISNTGRPASLGRLAFYESGTQTLKAVYAEDGVTPVNNPVVLDVNGRSPAIKLSDSDYKVVLETYVGTDALSNPVYAIEWTLDPYAPGSSTGGGSNTSIIANINTLINTDHNVVGDAVYVLGYYTPGDLGQGWFYWDNTSTATDDQGSVFNVIGGGATGRWIRQFDSEVLYPQQWGAMESIPGGTVSSRLLSLFAYADATNYQSKVIFPEQLYPVGGDISLTGVDTIVEFKRGARINRSGTNPTTVTFNVKDIIIPIQCAGIVGTEVNLSITTGDLSDIPVSAYNPNSGIPDMFTKAEGTYNGRLVIDDGYDLSGARDFSLSNLHFIAGGYVNFTAYTGNFTVTRYTFEKDLVKLFRGETEQVLFEGVKTFEAQHFVPVSNLISTGDYDTLLSTVTRGGTRVATLNWDYYSTYTIISAMTKSNTYRVEMYIADDSVVQFNNDAYFGFVKNGPGRKIFASVGGYPLLDQPIHPHWYGLTTNQNAGDESRNTSAINDAFETAALTKAGIVDCVDANININNSLIVPLPNDTSKLLTLKNCYLNIDATFTSTNVFETYGRLKLDNVVIDGTGSTGKVALRIRNNTHLVNSTITQILDIVNQNLGAYDLAEVNGCEFSGTRLVYDCVSTVYERFINNTFKNCPVTLNKPTSIYMSGNVFKTTAAGSDTNITLDSPLQTGYTCSDVIITSNTFISDSVNVFDNVSVNYGNIALGGHVNCSVKDNSVTGTGITIKATEVTYNFTFNNIDTTISTQYLADFTDRLILHAAVPSVASIYYTPPSSFSYVISGLSVAGTLALSVELMLQASTTTTPTQMLLQTNFGASSSWSGSIRFLIRTESNSCNIIPDETN